MSTHHKPMRTQVRRLARHLPKVLTGAVTAAMAVSLLAPAGPALVPVSHALPHADRPHGPALAKELGPGTRVRYQAETGKVRFIGTKAGQPIQRPSTVPASAGPAAVARAFLAKYGYAFGVPDQQRNLDVTSVDAAAGGRSAVRFQQTVNGVPVLGGELVINLDRKGNVLSTSGELLPKTGVATTPTVTAAAAQRTARLAVARGRHVPIGRLTAGKPSLWIHDSRIFGGPGLDRPSPVWRLDVTGPGALDEFVLVDARLGNVVLSFDQLETAKNRSVCDANNTNSQVPCTTPVRVEGGPASTQADVNNAYDYAGATYDFFFSRFGRDSLDGAGLPLKSTVRYCDPRYACPYRTRSGTDSRWSTGRTSRQRTTWSGTSSRTGSPTSALTCTTGTSRGPSTSRCRTSSVSSST